MKSVRFSIPLLIISLFCSSPVFSQGFKLSVSIPDLPNTDIILAHRFGLKFFTDDTVKTDDQGKAVFESQNTMAGGMYQIVFPDKKFVEFFIDADQSFSLSTKVSNPSEALAFKGSAENSRFLQWQRDYAANRSRATEMQNRIKKGGLTPDSSKILNDELKRIQVSNTTLWDSAIYDLAGTLPGKFIAGLKPVKIPESLGKQGDPANQAKQYQYLKDHFFDGVDFTDFRLLNTPLIETKLDQFFKQIAPPVADSIAAEATRLIEKSRPAPLVYQFVVQYLFNLYSTPEIMGTDAVYVYIAEKYYLTGQTPWIDSANLQGIKERVKELKPLLLGKDAPVLDGLVNPEEQPVEIKNIKANYLILYFWSPDCGFCKEATPKFASIYPELKQMGVEVVAVNTRIEKDIWTQFIGEHHLNWINVYSPLKVRELIDKYQAFTTPTLFILDPARKIIAKSISYDQVKPFLTRYISDRK